MLNFNTINKLIENRGDFTWYVLNPLFINNETYNNLIEYLNLHYKDNEGLIYNYEEIIAELPIIENIIYFPAIEVNVSQLYLYLAEYLLTPTEYIDFLYIKTQATSDNKAKVFNDGADNQSGVGYLLSIQTIIIFEFSALLIYLIIKEYELLKTGNKTDDNTKVNILILEDLILRINLRLKTLRIILKKDNIYLNKIVKKL